MRLLYIIAVSWLGTSAIMFATLYQDTGYTNTVTSIYEVHTANGSKIFMTFDQPDPICLYTPANYKESLDTTLYRAYLPHTSLADNVATSFEIEETDEGVELLLQGSSIDMFVGGTHMLFVVTK
ncbi:MAG: hypothetical protein CL947_00285 [Epsilonproteobacteria bacterium]|nr:hypothetical protein [Campylobacterota bacterium]